MKIIKIIKNDIETNSATFDSIEELNEWKDYHIIRNTFGLPERPESIVNENDELVQTGNILPAEYEIVIEDITDKLEQERINLESQQFLNSTDWKILRHRDQQDMGIATSLSGEEFQELLRQRQMARNSIVR